MRGFSLIEILAAIVIFAIMAAGVSSTLNETSKLTKRVKNRESTVLGAQIVVDRLQREMQMIFQDRQQKSLCFFKARQSTQGPDISFSFLDSPSRTFFERRSPGLKALRYFVEKSDEGLLRLMRSETSLDKVNDLERSPAQVIAEGVENFKFSFYEFQSDRWVESWDTSDMEMSGKFPRAIRFSFDVIDPTQPETSPKRRLSLETAFQVLNEMESQP